MLLVYWLQFTSIRHDSLADALYQFTYKKMLPQPYKHDNLYLASNNKNKSPTDEKLTKLKLIVANAACKLMMRYKSNQTR